MGKTRAVFARGACSGFWARAGGAAMLAALCGCSAPARQTFDFSTGLPTKISYHVSGPALAVAVSSAEALLDSDRLVIRGAAGELSYLSEAQWADRLPKLVQTRLIERLSAHGIDAVAPGAVASYQLSIDLRRFEIDSARQTAVVEIAARLTTEGGARRGAAEFLGEAPAPHTEDGAAPLALEAAMDRAAEQLVAWTRKRI